MEEYDDYKAIEFIRNSDTEKTLQHLSDDEILLILDCIWEYFEKYINAGYDDIDKISQYVIKNTAQDLEEIKKEYIELIVKGELDYETSLETDND